MRITENENIRNCIAEHIIVDGFNIHDTADCGLPLFVLNVYMHRCVSYNSSANVRSDITVKIHVYKTKSKELANLIEAINDNAFPVVSDPYANDNIGTFKMMDDYIHTYIDYINDYVTQYYSMDFQ